MTVAMSTQFRAAMAKPRCPASPGSLSILEYAVAGRHRSIRSGRELNGCLRLHVKVRLIHAGLLPGPQVSEPVDLGI
jgi:hypothetical protein